MRSKLIALKLFLDEMGVPLDISTVDKRKTVQKSIYLGQIAGVDLGYHFGWYKKGPYCPELTSDYYDLDLAISEGDNEYYKKQLQTPLKEKLESIKPILDTPSGLDLSQEDWLELIASVHYQYKINDETTAKQIIEKEKPKLAPYIDCAAENLKRYKLVNN